MLGIFRVVLSVLPHLAQLVLDVQRAAGVTHPTIAGTIAGWIIRGDRRNGSIGEGLRIPSPPASVEPKRSLDALHVQGPVHGDPYQDPPG
jgi:hypothetical protein